MKIGLVSDLHTDATEANKELIPFLISVIEDAEVDAFILAGDISASLTEFYDILDQFNNIKLECPKLFVPGNHDIWVNKDGGMTSTQKCGIISEICQDHDFHSLIDKPYIRDNVGFCGTIGWYDYSFAPKEFNLSIEQYEKKQFNGRIWNDKRFANWEDTDQAIAKKFEKHLTSQIVSIVDKVERIVVVSHHVPFRQCMQYRGVLSNDYFHAFMGSKGIGEICLKESLITHVFFGHLHETVDQVINNLRVVCSPVGYLHEFPQDGLQTYAERSLTCICLTD
ncbi:hypothetical protein C6497_08690 [Candidatus Poribacteria bacterium]|nr:MAG: hypothetical protein C6497_08690 [Candidatus Poribacteria bacterium]